MSGLQMKYFVLKPKGDDIYAKASRTAMNRYAHVIRGENPELAQELTDWTIKELTDAECKDISDAIE